jgi:hypothetical protein
MRHGAEWNRKSDGFRTCRRRLTFNAQSFNAQFSNEAPLNLKVERRMLSVERCGAGPVLACISIPVGKIHWVRVFLLAAPLMLPGVDAPAATPSPGTSTPTPADPYPVNAAGWGGEEGHGLYSSRWVEDWTGVRTAGRAPRLKAWPLGSGASLTLSAESRLRMAGLDNAQLTPGNDYEQGTFRGILGGDLRFNPHLRAFAEIGAGHVAGRRAAASANNENDGSLQQAFLEARGYLGSTLAGVMLGRQEFADGPRQIISLGNGPNLHRTWNGARFFAHDRRFRVGGFAFRLTRTDRGFFDETINRGERLEGLNGSFSLLAGRGTAAYLDPFWYHSEKPDFRLGGRTGLDNRDTLGVRAWGRRADFRFDWTLARQTGRYVGREIDAWGAFLVQSLTLPNVRWTPRLGLRVDAASGGGTFGPGTTRAFHPLYASTGYLGEGSFLSLSNLLLLAPNVSLALRDGLSFDLEYDFAWRLREDDAVYAGQMRTYAGTPGVPGREIGGLLRAGTDWEATRFLTLSFSVERLFAGTVLQRARLPSGTYMNVTAVFRY